MTPSRKPVVAVIGYTGGVGTCLLAAMEKIGIKPFALCRSSTMKLGEDSGEEQPVDYDKLGKRLLQAAASSTSTSSMPIIADVTASSHVQEQYKNWLSNGISVVTANKGIFAGNEKIYQELLTAAHAEPKAQLLHETTVGAGLPVLNTLTSLKSSSHSILKVEGILSGTLAFVLGEVAGGKKTLSEAVIEAKKLGYTEPDPRDDLNGMDVARKAVIIARIAGLTGIELNEMNIESLVPEPLRDCTVDEFLDKLPNFDEAFANRVRLIEEAGNRMHYAAMVDVAGGVVTVGPMSCESSHPFNNAGPDNMISITTNFYNPRPLVIQGAGAGGDVTATGVLADIMHCCS